ncbi:hypothetical protein MKW98_018919 [Papaver atlanticum]|uniref:Myb-like domain-containing protein n=1 Tax=Papaver atlanticum TaxID=357466 RepID=A0AAD4TG35_9MAGN|nr:hypothetical protein MKW98_018919 [Papaver atlanticum]
MFGSCSFVLEAPYSLHLHFRSGKLPPPPPLPPCPCGTSCYLDVNVRISKSYQSYHLNLYRELCLLSSSLRFIISFDYIVKSGFLFGMDEESVLRKSEKKKHKRNKENDDLSTSGVLKEKKKHRKSEEIEALSASEVLKEKKKNHKRNKEIEALSSSEVATEEKKKKHKKSKDKEASSSSEVPAEETKKKKKKKKKHKKSEEIEALSTPEVPTEKKKKKKKHERNKEKEALSTSEIPTDVGGEKGSEEKEDGSDNGREESGKRKKKKHKERVMECNDVECATDEAASEGKDHIDVSGEENNEHVRKGKGKINKRKNVNGGDHGESCIEKSDGEAESGSRSSKKRNREGEVLDVDIGEGKKKKKKKKGSKLDANIENSNSNIGDVETENNFGSTNEHLGNSESKKSSKRVKFANHVEVFPASDDQDDQEENPGTELIRGRFTKEEDQIIKDAIYKYIEIHELGEGGVDMIMHSGKHPNVRGCWNEIGAALPNRDSRSVRHRADILFTREEKDHDDVEENPGIELVRGKRFTKEEDQIIKDAVHKYIEIHELGEDGVDMIMHSGKHPNLRGCWKEIGPALPYRPYGAVSHRAHTLFTRDESRKWTEDEKAFVLKFHEKHGPNWQVMADVLGKNRYHVKDTWRRIFRESFKKGKWDQTEYQSLFNLVNKDLQMRVYEEKKSQHGMIRDNICWKAISQSLGTRTEMECCFKWYKQLSSSMVKVKGVKEKVDESKWADIDDYRLLDALVRLDACCVEDVDWDNLLEHRPGDITLKRWRQMVNHIGTHGLLSFGEQVEVLAKRYCPELLEVREALDSRPVVD